ncbi:MAG TPA: ABC-F family ATP-binding cassette domain-containing protein [Candidatus Methanomethylophilaceae archaeon]|nr:ABC-F family ATP-binding cassette domain-containing protein [Candidatus Methanomethylophilaceae archaeon]
MLLKALSIAKSFGPVKVLKDVSLQINDGDGIGLIGVNGAGKTTFLKILLGEIPPDTGEIMRNTEKIGYLPQFAESSPDVTVREVLGRPYGHIERINERMNAIEERMASGDVTDWNAIAEEYSRLESALKSSNEDDERRILAAIEEVGLSSEVMDRTMDTLSGGERTKIMLTRVLVQAEECDLLILDEPTSHLDIETVEFLEDFILDSGCALVVISHDRYFLDKVVTRVSEISNGKSREYKGNYSDFVMKKGIDMERMEKEYRRYTSKKRTQEEIAEELHKDQWFSALHKTREKLISKMEVKEKPEETESITVRIQAAKKSGKNVITAKGLSVELGGRMILKDVDIDIMKEDRIGIFGANGEGKSTLVKALIGEIPSEGELWVAPGAKIGYYSQNHEGLDLRLTAEEQILQAIGTDKRAEARNMLARLLLAGDDVDRPMSTLSGGQRARVALAMLLLKETNVLILDEPTNYLDIPSRHAVESALNEYDGTLVTVTHDRYFLDSVCTSTIEVKEGGIVKAAGTYSERKGVRNIREIVMDADEFRVLSPFKNWVNGRKYVKGERVLVTPTEMESFQWAVDQGKLRKTGGRQRKKVTVSSEEGGTKQ